MAMIHGVENYQLLVDFYNLVCKEDNQGPVVVRPPEPCRIGHCSNGHLVCGRRLILLNTLMVMDQLIAAEFKF